MASTKHRWALLATTIAASAAVAACGSSSGSSSDGGSSSGGTATITVGIPTDDASYAPLYLAEDRDLFAKYHVKVKPVVFKGGADLAKAVAGGSVDVAVSALSEMLLAVQQHQAMKAFWGGYNQTTFAWFGQKGLTSVEAGKGKKWGVTKIGSSTDFLTRYLFKQHGINPTDRRQGDRRRQLRGADRGAEGQAGRCHQRVQPDRLPARGPGLPGARQAERLRQGVPEPRRLREGVLPHPAPHRRRAPAAGDDRGLRSRQVGPEGRRRLARQAHARVAGRTHSAPTPTTRAAGTTTDACRVPPT